MSFRLPAVQESFPGRTLEWHDTIGSTMTRAAELAQIGAPSGTVIGADEQTAGQGRYGRPWVSERGHGLYITCILRLPLPPDVQPLATLCLGLATVDAILAQSGVACDLRWPNDVLIGSRKCAGILTVKEGDAILAGIGVNVNQPSFPSELASIATSLQISGGHSVQRELLLVQLLKSIDQYCDLLVSKGREPILDLFSQASSYVRGKRVTVEQNGNMLVGTTAGLDSSGFLILRHDDGTQSQILAGGVRPCS